MFNFSLSFFSIEKTEELLEMANQNVVVSDAITAAVAGPSIFPTAAQKPPAVPGTYISISQKKLVQNLDINSAARINSWVDSMRALSPTHIKSHSLSDHRNVCPPTIHVITIYHTS